MFLQRAGPYGVWGSWAEHRLGGCFDDELAFGQLGRAALRGRDFGDRAQQPVDNELEGGGGGGEAGPLGFPKPFCVISDLR